MKNFTDELPEEGRIVKVTYFSKDLKFKTEEIIWTDDHELNYDVHLLEWCYI